MFADITVKVSIITVCYNAADCIENAIKSVLSQTYKGIEYIIIDGRSNDRTLDIVNNYRDRISTVISERDNGTYDAMNKGVKIATGDLVFFLNADDTFHNKDVVSDVVTEMTENGDAALLYGNVVYFDRQSNIEDLRVFKHINKKNLIHENLCHQGVFAKRYLFDFSEAGMFDLRYRIAADYDWLLKVFLNKKYQVLYFNRIIAKFNYGGIHVEHVVLSREERLEIQLKYNSKFCFYIKNYIYRFKRKLKNRFFLFLCYVFF